MAGQEEKEKTMKAPINSSKTRPEEFLLDAMVAGTSNAIELQESSGQHSFVASETLPTEGDKGPLEAAGVKFLRPVDGDPLFQFVELPKGWKKQATDHSMHSDLLDEQGRKRAGIFYKAAFYDRSAHFYCNARFSVHKDYDARGVSIAKVFDGEAVIYTTIPLRHFAGSDRETLLKNYKLDEDAHVAATRWLEAKYPDWKNAAAYWSAAS